MEGIEGIYIDGLDNIISKLRNIEENSKANFRRIENSFELLDECFHGNDINIILRRPANSSLNFSNLVSNYINILESVKKSYLKQDEIFREQLNHINSKVREV